MRIHALAFCLILSCVTALPALAGDNKAPPPSNSKISVEDAARAIDSMPSPKYYDLHVRRNSYAQGQAAYQAAMDARREIYNAPMAQARHVAVEDAGGSGAMGSGAFIPMERDISPAAGTSPSPALTESEIRDVYAQSATAHLKPFALYRDWAESHFHKNSRMTQTVTIKLPGASPVVESRTLSYRQLMEDLEENYKAMRGVTMKGEVTDVLMGPDGTTAKVKDKSIITGMSVPAGDGKMLRGDGKSACDDEVVFTPGKGVQVLRSVCTLDLTLSPLQDL